MDSRMATRRRRLEQLVVGIGAAASSDLDAVEEELEAALAEQHAVTKRVAALTKQKDELLQKPTPMEAYSFDKDGYIVLHGALSPAEVRACNDTLDSIPWNPEEPDGMQPGEWWGGVQSHNYGAGGFWKDGVNLQQIYESGPAFEAFIDHPSWFEKIKTFVGSEGSFDSVWGPVFIDENLANFRGPGEAIGIHSGGKNLARNSYHYQSGRFMAMQVNVLVALTDIGPGDGGTMLIPASHKTNLPHPGADQSTGTHKQGQGLAVDGHPGAIEVFMKAGDALLFTDAIAHGSARRVNEGFRRICVMRYMPSWANFRMPYEPTQELLARLTPQRRQVVAPLWANKLAREPQRKEDEEEELLLQEQLDDSGTKNPILPNGRIKGWV